MIPFQASLLLFTLSGQLAEPGAVVLSLLEGDQVEDYYGWVAANLPDVDGDGVDDLIIPAIGYDDGAGRVTVYSGATRAVLADIVGVPGTLYGYSVGAAGDVDADGVPDYIVGGGRVEVFSGATHHLLWSLGGITGFAHSVGGAGDVDGDGHDDVIVGAQRTDTTTVATGQVFVFSGANGLPLWTRDGASARALFGSAVGAVGDVNGDCVPDVVVGAYGAKRAYILSGRDGATLHELAPEDPARSPTFGRFFASGAGDVDRDGWPDVFIGDYGANARGADGTGQAYVFSGRTGQRLHLFTGVHPGDGLGPGRGIPDANGDHHADVLVAAYTNGDGAPAAGKAYLFSGRSGALLRTFTATLQGDNFGVDALSMGDVDGDGHDDFLVTAVGLAFEGLDHGRAYLIAGAPLPCPADLDGDRRVGILDLVRLLRATRTHAAAGDLDGDGDVDAEDVSVLLEDWGRCPRR